MCQEVSKSRTLSVLSSGATPPAARREALLPFVLTVIGRSGQIFGNQTKGSLVSVTNGKKFSYPGYNEILTGFGDPAIDHNDKKPNPNVNVFEWLNGRPGLRGRVAVFGTWTCFPIFSTWNGAACRSGRPGNRDSEAYRGFVRRGSSPISWVIRLRYGTI